MEDSINTQQRWEYWQQRIAQWVGTDKVDITAMLFLIGVQELGAGVKTFSKREKEELMHIATCKLLSKMGFYELNGQDEQGWPIWEKTQTIPNYSILEQEYLMKKLIITYLEENFSVANT